MMEVRYGPWLPEVTDYKNPGLEECRNAIPSPSGYIPALANVATSTTVSGTIVGARGLERSDGTSVIIVVTTSDIYTIVATTANASSLSLTLDVSNPATIEQFGSEVYATTKEGVWKLDDIESDTTFAAASDTPYAKAMGTVDDFLVMGNLTDIDASDAPYRLRWSQFNNPAGDWATDIATQAGAVDLDASQGPIEAISGGTIGFIFQKFGISRIVYNGTASVFDLELYEKDRGCAAPQSVVRVGDRAFFLSFDGFFETDGASVRSISRNRIWQWFVENVDQGLIKHVQGSLDWEKRCVVWAVPTGTTSARTSQLWYNWETESWSHVDVDSDFLVSRSRTGLTLEQVGALYPNIDTMPLSLDSDTFKASGRTMSAFVSGALTTTTGATLEAEFIGGDLQPYVGKRTFVRSVTPLVESETQGTQVALLYRDVMSRSQSATDLETVGPAGFAAMARDARYFAVRVVMPAGDNWGEAYGYQVEYTEAGWT